MHVLSYQPEARNPYVNHLGCPQRLTRIYNVVPIVHRPRDARVVWIDPNILANFQWDIRQTGRGIFTATGVPRDYRVFLVNLLLTTSRCSSLLAPSVGIEPIMPQPL